MHFTKHSTSFLVLAGLRVKAQTIGSINFIVHVNQNRQNYIENRHQQNNYYIKIAHILHGYIHIYTVKNVVYNLTLQSAHYSIISMVGTTQC